MRKNKTKYEPLAKGERKAVRKTGAKKEAKKGIITDIYSGEQGGRLVTAGTATKGGRAKANQGAITEHYRTAGNKPKATVGSALDKAAAKQKAADVNQSEFSKTRLGSKIESRAKKSGKPVVRKLGVVKSKKR